MCDTGNRYTEKSTDLFAGENTFYFRHTEQSVLQWIVSDAREKILV